MLLRRAFLFSSVTWALWIPLAAFAASRAAAPSLLYAVGVVAYSVGHLICHQLPERSFHLWGASLPVCARCTGIYLGASITSLVLASREGGSASFANTRFAMADVSTRTRLVLLIALIPTAATLIFEWTTAVTPGNWVRALAGVPLGAAVAWAVGMVN